MSWIEKLYETYERCADRPQFENQPILPPFHYEKQAHIEIVLDGGGNFRRASSLANENTPIPATEGSAGRTSTKVAPHPLFDKIQYCAGDYSSFGGTRGHFEAYLKQLVAWQNEKPNPKVQAVLEYVRRRTLVADLVKEGQLYCGIDHKLLTEWKDKTSPPPLFRNLSKKKDKDSEINKTDQGDAFVRWRVEIPGDPDSALWEDRTVRESWITYQQSRETQRGLCMVTGATVALGENHPKRLRNPADGAKLLSSNDKHGFTFRGRFEKASQAYGVGSEVSQKAHNALKWLIGRQKHRPRDAVFVAWDTCGAPIPDPFSDTGSIFSRFEGAAPMEYTGDAGQLFAHRLSKMIAGYRANLSDSAGIVVMGLDAATPGRLAIIFYRELTGSEFLDRLSAWHMNFAWHQNYSHDKRFVGAPAPREIAECAYGRRGRRGDEKLRRATVERLLPSIIDGRPVPRDLVESTFRRAANRAAFRNKEKREWKKCLGVACALWRGGHPKEKYQMALEPDRVTRDYLFGRLLAIADNIEERALHLAKEERSTHAARFMHRFAMHPNSTWRNIALAIGPSKNRLKANRPATLLRREKLLDQVLCQFQTADFISDAPLSGEFLLGYHCQRAALWQQKHPGAVEKANPKGRNNE